MVNHNILERINDRYLFLSNSFITVERTISQLIPMKNVTLSQLDSYCC